MDRHAIRRNWRTRTKIKAAANIPLGVEALEKRELLAADVIISEIMFHPSSNDDGQEYIELYNRGDTAANLSNWQFDRGVNYQFTGGTLGVGQFLVVAADVAKFNAKYPGVSNVVGGWMSQPGSGTLANGGEEIRLLDNLGATVDQVQYADDGDWGVRERGRGTDLIDSITSTGTTDTTAVVTLFNHGYLNGDTVRISGAAQPEYNGIFVINTVTGSTFRYTMASAPSGPATGHLLSRHLINRNHSGWSWGSDADGLGKSLELINPALTNNEGQNWAPSQPLQGTPGVSNSVNDADIAPMITEIRQTPIIPRPTDNVVITTELKDENAGGDSATLFWRRDNLTSSNSWNSVVMNDSGTAGDAIAGDGIWSGIIPPQVNNAVVEYYISASDGLNTRRYPAPASIGRLDSLSRSGGVVTGTTPMPHGMRVGDTITISGASSGFNGTFVITSTTPIPTTAVGNVATSFTYDQAGADADAANPGSVIAQSTNRLYQVDSNSYSGGQMYFKLTMTEAERAELNNISNGGGSDHQSDANVHGTFIAQGPDGLEVRHNVGFRNRGGGSRISATQPNYHISLSDDETWAGITALNFNGEYSAMDVIGSAIFRAAGVPAQKVSAVQVRVNNANRATNGTQSFGSYAWMQSEDSTMADDLWPLDPQGNLYHATDDEGTQANLQYLNSDPASYLRAYQIQTNADTATYEDIMNLTRAFSATQTPDEQFVAAVNANIHVDEWMRYLATGILLGHQETTLSSGFPDDYSLYAGVNDPRFFVLPHDIDTLLGVGDGAAQPYRGAFQAMNVAAMGRLLRHPTFAPMYAAALKELADTVFKAENINALIDNTLASYVPEVNLDSMKGFVANRITALFNPASAAPPIPLKIRVTPGSLPASVNGYPQVTTDSVSFAGQANAIKTRSVLVNGQPAAWVAGPPNTAPSATQTMGNWTADVTGLRPGINRILIQSLDASGVEFERSYQDIWYDDGSLTTVSGTLPVGTTTWTAANGPYHVTTNVIVPAGATLVIQPGTTVFFEPGTQLQINGGRLDAQGNDLARIRLTRTPGAASNWSGIRFSNTMLDNRLAYVDQAFGATSGNSIGIASSRASMDHMEWSGTLAQIIDITNSSFRLTNSILPTIGAEEMVHFSGTIPAGGEALIQGNIFGGNLGFNDAIDFTGGQRNSGTGPYQIMNLVDNIFMGPYEDDILDLDGTDAHIEGNVFMNAHLVDPNNPDTSSAVSGGLNGADRSEWTVVRNFFYDLDHANLTKEGAFLTFVNNTVVNVRVAGINFDEPGRTGIVPGQGAYLDGNIFWNVPQLFENLNSDGTTTQITVNRSIVPTGTPAFPGTALSTMDPNLLNTVGVLNPKAELILRPGPGPAAGTGPNGVDMGADIPAGATIGGVPLSPTRSNSVNLTIGGPEIWGYRFRLDGGAWSTDRQVARQIAGTALARSGSTVTVALAGHGYVNGNTVRIHGALQPEFNGTFTISGVTANTFNYTAAGSTLAGSGTAVIVQRQEPIVLTGLTNGTHTIEVIRKTSAGIWQPEAQATRKTWTVNTALPAPTVRINEVLAQNTAAANHSGTFPDIIELHNPGTTSIDLLGMSITDDPLNPRKFVFTTSTTVAAGGYLILYADSANNPGIHTGFSLGRDGEGVYLFNTLAAGGTQLDGVTFGYQLDDLSISRQADLSWRLSNPTFGLGPNFPGAANTALAMGDPQQLLINEWGTHGLPPFSQDFVEIYNTSAHPIDMGGMSISDQPLGWPEKSVIPALTFIGGKDHFHFIADNDPEQGADHLDFTLASERGEIGLFDAAGNQVDLIIYATQQAGLSQGRSPDAGPLWQFFAPPNPGVTNPAPTPDPISTVPLIADMTHVWHYNDNKQDLGTAWREIGYDDSAVNGWDTGGGLLYHEDSTTVGPKTTPLDPGSTSPLPTYTGVTPTFYFRTHFTLNHPVSSVLSLQLRTMLDDGMVVYLNGQPLLSHGMPTNVGPIGFGTYTTSGGGNGRNVTNASLEAFTITDLSALVQGDNVLAVEVHQANSTSSDVVWGATLSAVIQGSVTPPPNLRITEVNYNPTPGGAAFSPNDYEYIELQNTGPTPINLAGIEFATGVVFEFTSGTLAPGATGVIVKNQTAFTNRYGSGINILGQYTDSLDDNGEGLRLVDSQGAVIQDFAYSDSWHPTTDGSGHTLVIIDPSADPSTWLNPASWRPSKFVFGSPQGIAENATAVDAIVINEISSNGGAGTDWIELHNTTTSPINVGGWYLTNSAENLLKYRIPDNITINGGEHISFQESQFNTASPIAFTLSELGGDVYLSSSAAPGVLSGYHTGLSVGAAESGVTFGRYTTSTGRVDFPPLSAPTRDAANAAPKVGPIIINEFMYNPATTNGEFIEIRNVSGASVILDNWKISEAIDFTFPAGTSLGAGQLLLLVDQDPAIFRSTYNVPAGVQILQFVGGLDNAGEDIVLSKPGPLTGGFTPYYLVDRVNYDDDAPWPTAADGDGPSLARQNALEYGNDPINWAASTANGGTPGRLNFGGSDVILNGTTGNDTYYIRRNGANLEVFLGSTPTGQPAFVHSAESASFTFNGDAGNDRLIVDFSNGAPLDSGDIIYNGGTQTAAPGDTLTVIGGSGANNTGSYTPTTGVVGAGTVSVGGHNINFAGLEPVLVNTFNTFTFTTPASNDSLTIDGPVAGQTRVSGTSGGVAFENISFTNVTNFIIDTGANDAASPNDTISINGGTAATGLSALQIRLGLGANTINSFGGTSNLNISTTSPGTVTVNVNNASTVNFMASQRLTSLNINSTATARLAAGGGKVLRVNNFAVATGAVLDLTDNDLIIQSTAANKATLYSTIFGYLQTGRAGGAWSGRRINSSTAAASRITNLAAIVNDTGDGVTRVRTDLGGQAVDVNTILVKYTYTGDADLDGDLDTDDYARIDNAYASSFAGGDYLRGDFDYSGTLDADDYFYIDRAFSGQGAPLSSAAPAPEPASSSEEIISPEPAAPAPEVVAEEAPAPATEPAPVPEPVATTEPAPAAPTVTTTTTTSIAAPQPERKKSRRHRHHRSGDRDLKVEQKPQAKWKLPGAFLNRR